MSYRIEKKFILDPRKYEIFIRYINCIKAKKIHNKRKVFSTYYDNDYFSSYKNSEEGVVPRKKIRIRSYNTNYHGVDSKLELKISSEENRFKTVRDLKDKEELKKFLSTGYLDKTYGYCKPILDVSYLREYYLIKNCRITIDKNIVYSGYHLNKKSYDEPLSVIEFKSDIDDEINFENNILFNPISRFSKYCRGMNKVFFNIKNY